jgi:hypothetical protein
MSLIILLFRSCRWAGAEDADSIASFRMDDDQEAKAAGRSDQNAPLFVHRMNRVGDGDRLRIGEDACRFT